MYKKFNVCILPIYHTLKAKLNTAFSQHLLATNVTVSLSLSGIGDIIQQHYRIIHCEQKHWDKHRTKNMTCTGVTVGVLCHHWYQLLDRHIPGKCAKSIFRKVAFDQLLFSPVCIAVFLITLRVMKKTDEVETSKTSSLYIRGLTDDDSICNLKKDFYEKGLKLYVAEMFIWPPVQVINFYFLSTKYRVLFDNIVSLMYDIYSSYVCYNSDFNSSGSNSNLERI